MSTDHALIIFINLFFGTFVAWAVQMILGESPWTSVDNVQMSVSSVIKLL